MSKETDNFLAHYGVPGMKWGHTKGDTSSGSASTPSRKEHRAERNNEILRARVSQQARGRKFQEAQGEFILARSRKGQEAAEKVMRKREAEFFTHPDAKTAAKLTTGEKWVTGIGWGAVGVSTLALLAAGRG